MSSRALRRFLGKDDLLEKLADDEISDNEPELPYCGDARRKTPNVNQFDLLNEETESEAEEAKEGEDDANAVAAADGENTSQDDSQQKRKKKKKKKKKKQKQHEKTSEVDEEEDILQKYMAEVKASASECTCPYEALHPYFVFRGSVFKPTLWHCDLMGITPKKLNATNELKKIFGSKIVEGDSRRRRGRGRVFLRNLLFVVPKQSWPPLGKTGLSMRLDRSDTGHWFVFNHSPAYQEVQKKFFAAVDSFNPDNIMAIINEHPYHVDALLQLSDLCKLSEDYQMAADLNERALYCLESAFHPSFSIIRGNCQMDYRRQENRAFYICLFKHMLFVGQRACYETALEIAKAILILDYNTDPLAVILSIDFYALRSRNYQFLISAKDDWMRVKNATQLPNFAFSVALAYFYRDEPEDKEYADVQLQNALIAFPSTLCPLLEKCCIQIDPRVAAHPFFTTEAHLEETKPLSWIISLYVHRTYHEWKAPEVLPWLEKNVHIALDRVDAGDPYVKESIEIRKSRYNYPPINVMRHILLSDIKEVASSVAREVRSPILSFDPLPPYNSIDLYKPRVREESREESSIISAFFRSLLPNYISPPPPAAQNMNNLADRAAAVAGAAEAPDGARGGQGLALTGDSLRISVAALMDAIGAVLEQMADGGGNDNNEGEGEDEEEPGSNHLSDDSDQDVDPQPGTEN